MVEDVHELIAHLTERYTRYRAILEQVAEAIGTRNAECLTLLEHASSEVLQDIHHHWSLLENGLFSRSAERDPAGTAFAILEHVIKQAADQLALNQASLAQWTGEVGREAHGAWTRGRALEAYSVGGDHRGERFGLGA
jgi:hypothetical protein